MVLLQTLIRYALVGGGAAAIHLLLLLLLPRLGAPLPLANVAGYLTALLWGYVLHAVLTFRRQTSGELFPRRWLLLQLVINLSLSLGLPQLMPPLATHPVGIALLVFTPTAVNALVWWLAAHQVQRLRRGDGLATSALQFHADDLGLCTAVNASILALADRGLLQGTSVMLNGSDLSGAVAGLALRPQLNLVLHLVLTEGLPIAEQEQVPDLLSGRGELQLKVHRLLLLSFWPRSWDWPQLRRQRHQLRLEVDAQIDRFCSLWPDRPLQIDGHQHVHLMPVVWWQLMASRPQHPVAWVRTVHEPLPVGLPLGEWWSVLRSAGWLKWLLLQSLSELQRPELAARGIATNQWFAGVLCTGRMGDRALQASLRSLRACLLGQEYQHALVLLHPSEPLQSDRQLERFAESQAFYRSPWRQREAQALLSGAGWMSRTK